MATDLAPRSPLPNRKQISLMSFTRRVSSHVTLSATHKRERSSQGNLKGRLQEKGQRLDTKREKKKKKIKDKTQRL